MTESGIDQSQRAALIALYRNSKSTQNRWSNVHCDFLLFQLFEVTAPISVIGLI